MSVEAINAIRERRFGSALRKSVIYVLADLCNASWSCIVGQARLAAEAEVGERTVRSFLREFEAEGIIRREKRYRGFQGRTSDRTMLVKEAIASLPASIAASDPLAASDDPLPASDDRSSGTSFAGEPLENRKEEPSGTGTCPECQTGQLIEKPGKLGRFLSCDRYRRDGTGCNYSENLPRPVSTWTPTAADLEEMRRAHGEHVPPFLERVELVGR
jgi:hypothetical protein